jgi:hypothetical protein
MIRKLSTWLVVALTGGAFVAGCGSSTNSTSSSQTTPTAASSPAVQQAVAGCKESIQALPASVPTYAKTSLEGVCEKDASRGLAAVERGARNLCLDAVYNSVRPPKPAERAHILAICNKAR